MNEKIASVFIEAGLKPTSNRILVYRALQTATSPKGLVELETELETLERSSILRVLRHLHQHGLIHTLEDGKGIIKYEVCHSKDHHSVNDMHAHFYCEKCERVFCFEEIETPHTNLPEGFSVNSVNFMIKGICPDCRRQNCV